MNKSSIRCNALLSKKSGFTLIELLIAISILSLLLFTGSYSYSLLMNRWDKELGSFNETANNSRNLQRLQSVMTGVMPYVVVDREKEPSFFFVGHEQSLLAVTRNGLFSGDFPEVFRLSTIADEQGKQSLVYQAVSTENLLLKGVDQEVKFEQQVTLFAELDDVAFSYFGYNHLFDKTSGSSTINPIWQSTYSGIDKRLIPNRFQVNLVKTDKPLILSAELDSNAEFFLTPYSKSNL